ncbi:twin-arginine translocase TatA/TatE family subunit [Thiothrix eikelboomii]|uniref:Sec-independent protein translocase protein TatA n=1 Tax=Thiothrix eikelboomii TaxID=92487 RepID=A0A1T4WF82_9GAMM|nr:twin-arginine translocase TatA/TatE family subunit [Thiothrix eikelboomii]SKA75974.1 sec-independent protein translocase protein TatA [Thiothrix eikelboomii]
MHFSPLQLVLILVIVILLFGTKKLRSMGGDLGEAFKNFRKAVKDGDEATAPEAEKTAQQIPPANSNPIQGNVIDVQAKEKDKV